MTDGAMPRSDFFTPLAPENVTMTFGVFVSVQVNIGRFCWPRVLPPRPLPIAWPLPLAQLLPLPLVLVIPVLVPGLSSDASSSVVASSDEDAGESGGASSELVSPPSFS